MPKKKYPANSKKRHHSSGHHSVLAPVPKLRMTDMSETKIAENTQISPASCEKDANQEIPVEAKGIEGRLDEIIKMVSVLPAMEQNMRALTSELNEQKKSLEFAQEDIEELKKRITDEENITKRLEKRLAKLEEEKEESVRLERHVINLEYQSRRDNLILENITEQPNENCKHIASSILREELGISEEIKLSRVHRLKSIKQPRPIIVKFHYFPHRDLVWSKRANLKGSTIRLREDYPTPIEKSRSTLMPFLRAAQRQKKKAKLVRDRLIIDEKTYTIMDLHKLPPELLPRKVFERRTEDGSYHLFGGKHSPFSNWHPAPFTINGRKYSCSEQYYLYQKAVFAKDTEKASEILKAEDPAVMKKSASSLQLNVQQWNRVSRTHMKDAIAAKFSQNPRLKNALIETSPTQLVECNRFDSFWSCGLNLYALGVEDRDNWTGKNVLGQLLTELRGEMMT